MKFTELALGPGLQKALVAIDYHTPTPIQKQSIPKVLAGRDLLACAQTGTGKTAAFTLPILERMLQNQRSQGDQHIRALVLTPTRELAIQIDENLAAYTRHVPISHTVIFGGVKQHKQVRALQRGIDFLVATPGRLLDLVGQGLLDLSQLEYFVLDEADRMLDMGFINDVRRVLRLIPRKRQSLFFSATLPQNIVELAGEILTDPVQVEVTPVSSTVDVIDQSVYYVAKRDKRKLLLHLLDDPEIETALVFSRTKHGANKIAKVLSNNKIAAEAIHGNKSQNHRQRVLQNFKDRKTRVLVATDIAARGIDVEELSHVINFDLPNVPETYVHRIGRTGRAGASGIALSFCDGEERAYLRDIKKLIDREIPAVPEHPFVDDGKESVAPANGSSRPNNYNGGGSRGSRNYGGGGGGGNRNRSRNRSRNRNRRSQGE
jgi:ATP-dependent RNA helicase RhlE